MANGAPHETQPTVEAVERGLELGDGGTGIDALLKLLDARAAAGDATCALAARALRRKEAAQPFAPDAMAAAVDRLVHLVRKQEGQIRALRAMVEAGL